MTQSSPCVGVLLAAGRGRRMGQTKQLMPWPPGSESGTVVAAAFDCIAPHCASMIVVTGHDAAAVAHALTPRQFEQVQSDPDVDLVQSITLGLRRAQVSAPEHHVVLHLADHPAVSTERVQWLLREFTSRGKTCAVIGQHRGKGGHPVIIPHHIIPDILNWNGDGGLRQFWIDHPTLLARIDADDPNLIRDLDTPDDYRA